MRIIFISYDGILEPLGYSQVFEYLKRLSGKHEIWLVSFEKNNDLIGVGKYDALKKTMIENKISWSHLRYHKLPTVPATAYDVARGLIRALLLIRKHKIEVVHTRGYVVSLIPLFLKKILGFRWIFDMRGFWADEKVEGGDWTPKGGLYRITKYFEKKFLLNADAVISLSYAGKKELLKMMPPKKGGFRIEVIPTCTNLEKFTPEKKSRRFIERGDPLSHPTVGYLGSASFSYLLEPALQFFKIVLSRFEKSKFLIINREHQSLIRDRCLEMGIPESAFEIRAVEHEAVADEIRKMDFVVFFIRPSFSKTASSPTKLGEILGCGVPCVTNDKIGDVTEIIEESQVGCVVRDFSETSLVLALDQVINLTKDAGLVERCVKASRKYFDINEGVKSYHQIYESFRR